jgi:hypothetical protein
MVYRSYTRDRVMMTSTIRECYCQIVNRFLCTPQTAVLADVVARVSGGDSGWQRARLPERLHGTISPHGDKLFHRITGDCRHHGRHIGDAVRRLQRGMLL